MKRVFIMCSVLICFLAGTCVSFGIIVSERRCNALVVKPNAIIQTVQKQADKKAEPYKFPAKLDSYIKGLDNFHGAVLVAMNGKIILKKGYGYLHGTNGPEITPSTIFPLASVTKQFTAMAIMQLYERKKLSLDDELSKYIPDYPRGDEISIHYLLTHQSGIVNCTNLEEFWRQGGNNSSILDVINIFKNKPLDFTPGNGSSYSNSGYIVLSYIIEKVSGQSYGEFLKNNIFHPLGMNQTSMGYSNGAKMFDANSLGTYTHYGADDEDLLKAIYGAGSLCSSIDDLQKWDEALYTEKLVKKETAKLIFTSYRSNTGYGWGVYNNSHGMWSTHAGALLGYKSCISRLLDRKLVIIVLTSNANCDVIGTSDYLSKIVFSEYK